MSQEPNELEALKRENEELRERLAKSTFETEMYRKAAYEMLDAGPPPTDEEIEEAVNGPRGQSLWEILEEYERIPGE